MTQIMLAYDPSKSASPTGGASGSTYDDPDADLMDPPPPTESQPVFVPQQETQGMDVDREGLIGVFTHIYNCVGVPCQLPNVDSLEHHVITASLPFLRCAALLFQSLTDVPEPPQLHALCEPLEEYKVITEYLALPSRPADLFTTDILQLITHRCSDKRVVRHAAQGLTAIMPLDYPLSVNKLIELPEDYSDLINSASLFMCPNSMGSDESRIPTLCLVCGEMLCSGSFCCQVELNKSTSSRHNMIGAASAHMQTCGAGNGIFLRVRQCQVVLLSGQNKGCFLPAPYVDDYGETDVTLKRGNPMHLCKTAYKDLHRLWLSHSIPEKVARSVVTSTAHHLLAEWFHL